MICQLSVLINKFLGNVDQFDLDILRAIHWSSKVEILDIKGTELGPWTRENTIDDKFDKFEGGIGGGHFPGNTIQFPAMAILVRF